MRVIDHLLATRPSSRQMFVIKHRHTAPAFLKHLHTFLEPLVARIQRLAFFVARILAVLRDDHHTIDREFAGAQRQRLLDARVKFQAVPLHAITAKVCLLRELINVHRGDVRSRLLPTAAPTVAKRQSIQEMLRMRMRAHLRAKEGNPLTPAGSLAKRRHRANGRSPRQKSALPQEKTSSGIHKNGDPVPKPYPLPHTLKRPIPTRLAKRNHLPYGRRIDRPKTRLESEPYFGLTRLKSFRNDSSTQLSFRSILN